jgi:hypothetical protein
VLPSEYHPHVFGGSMEETCEFDSLDQGNAILGLLSRHWNTIAGTLYADEIYLPLLLEDDTGVAAANDWALASRSPSSWPPRACACCRSTTSARASTIASGC